VIQSSRKVLKELVGEIICSKNTNNLFFSDSPPFSSYEVLTLGVPVMFDHLTGPPRREFVDVQILEARLSGLGQ
jgi:hypothetical protein